MNTTKPASVIPPSTLSVLEGSIALTSAPDILQFLNLGRHTGELRIVDTDRNETCKVFFADGEIVHVDLDSRGGLAALVELLDWRQGYFRFRPGVSTIMRSLDMPFQHLLMETFRLKDERKDQKPMADAQKSSSDILQELLKVPGVNAVVVVGRDGFVIESAGQSGAVDLDSIGASLAHAINGIEEMGSDLKVDRFTDLFIEYKRSVLLCSPVGDAIVALVTPDASKLGIIRHKARKSIEELSQLF